MDCFFFLVLEHLCQFLPGETWHPFKWQHRLSGLGLETMSATKNTEQDNPSDSPCCWRHVRPARCGDHRPPPAVLAQ